MRVRERLIVLGLGLSLAAVGMAVAEVGGAPGVGPEVEWVAGYGGRETGEHPHAAVQASDGGFVIVGESTGDAGSGIFVVRTDERGAQLFARSYGAGRVNLGNFVLEESDGSFLIAGSWDVGAWAVREDRVLLRLGGDGEVQAMRTYAAPGRDAIEGIALNADGTIIAVGYRSAAQDELGSFIVDTGHGFVMKLNPALGVVWERSLPAADHVRRRHLPPVRLRRRARRRLHPHRSRGDLRGRLLGRVAGAGRRGGTRGVERVVRGAERRSSGAGCTRSATACARCRPEAT